LGGSGNNGESCIIESEDGFIGIIDCFTDRIQKKPIPQHFLEHHQITLDKVKFILISHLHGDHCDGVVDLIKNYPLAKLYISQINLLKSFRTLIKFQHPNLKFSGWTKGQKLFKYLSDNPDRQIEGLTEGDEIFFTDDIQLNVLYPSQDCINYFDKFYKEKLDKITSKVKDIESRKNSNLPKVLDIDFSNNFNDHSVVIEALSNEFNSIYLADLEFQKKRGLGYVLRKASEKNKQYNVFKVPHHGSKTSFDINKWEGVLVKPLEEQILKLTCWKKGVNFLPEPDIVKQMLGITEHIFCTGIPQRETVKINNKTKKYYNNPKLKFSIATHDYGEITVQYDYQYEKLDLNIRNPAIHISELLNG